MQDPEVLRESYPDYDQAILHSALRYYEAYPDEIEARIALNQRGPSRPTESGNRRAAAGSWPRNVKHPDQFFEEFTSDPVVDEAMRRLAK